MGPEPNAKITLYTNHRCPWAHRAHIALQELGLEFEEVIIDLDKPRTAEYLRINPRGLVPSLSYNGEIITESAIVAQFLADSFPSALLPPSTDADGPLFRARVAFFVDAYFSKVNGIYSKALFAKTEEEAGAFAESLVAAVVKEIEPLLANASPFFGGSKKLTLAETLTGSFVLRLVTFAQRGLLPEGLAVALRDKAPNFSKWSQAVVNHPSVLSIWDEDAVLRSTKARIEKLRTGA